VIAVGSTVSGYRADRVVGKGATATVFAAMRLADLRPVALKLLAPALQANPTLRARFHDTARLQQSLEHPNVAEVYEVGESDGESFVAMRLAKEGTLASLIDEGLDARRALELLGQVAEALDFAHSKAVCHGDLKPSNVLIDDGCALLADFGLAVALRQGTPAAATAPGTIHYAAPERLRGDPPTPSADVYGLACVLFECLTGAVPYPHGTSAAAVGAHLFNAPPLATALRPGLPPAFDDVLARGLAKDARDRPGSARELVSAAESVLARSGPVPGPPPSPEAVPAATGTLDDTLSEPLAVLPDPPEIETDRPRRISGPLLAGIAAATALAVVLGAWLGQRRPDDGRSLARGPLTVVAPTTWRDVPTTVLPGVAIQDPLALVPRARPRDVTFAMGTVRGVPPTFLPRSLLQRLQKPPRSELVQLEHGVAYRYARLTPAGYGRVLTLYVLPGLRRSALASCSAAPTETPSLADCGRVAETLEAGRLAVYDPRPDLRFASAVNAAFRVLRVARNSGLATLGKAETARAQARAATGVAVAYRTTVASVRRTRPPAIAAGVTRDLAAALDGAGVGYTRLAGAARRRDAAAYDRARALIGASETSIAAALGELRDLGYRGQA
jgi:serine/threonine protein kinase, bacterial